MNFHPKCYYRQVFCAKLGIAVHECIRETLSWVDPHAIHALSSVFHWYIWCKLSELSRYRKYQLTERWLEGKLEGFFGFSKQNGAHRIPNKSKSKCLICKGHLQQISAVLVLCALKTVQWIYSGDFKINSRISRLVTKKTIFCLYPPKIATISTIFYEKF